MFAVLLCLFLFSTPQVERGTGGALLAPDFQGCEGPYDVADSPIVYQWPFESISFNQYFSWGHPGVDLFARPRDPIHSVGYGFVSKAEFMNYGYGWHVVIDHGEGWQTLYAHMIEEPPVEVGDYVFPGKVVGYAGSTGRSTGTHLHFEVLHNDCYLEPRTVIDGSH